MRFARCQLLVCQSVGRSCADSSPTATTGSLPDIDTSGRQCNTGGVFSAMRPLRLLIPLSLIALLVSCGDKEAPRSQNDVKVRAKPTRAVVLKRFDFSADPITYELSDKLREISGIAFDPDGRLWAHGDERGVVYELDPGSGKIVRNFTLGEKGVKGDFEDIQVVGNRFYMITSNGVIYEFAAGDEDEAVTYLTYETGLSTANDVEGLCYDPSTNALLVACKGDPGVPGRVRSIYSFDLGTKRMDPVPRWVLRIDSLTSNTDRRDFRPSALARDPETGHYLLLTSADNAIAELDSTGTILGSLRIRRGEHQQPEGLAFAPDGSLLVSDEADKGVATVSVYKPLTNTKTRKSEDDELEILEHQTVIPPPVAR